MDRSKSSQKNNNFFYGFISHRFSIYLLFNIVTLYHYYILYTGRTGISIIDYQYYRLSLYKLSLLSITRFLFIRLYMNRLGNYFPPKGPSQ